MVEVLHADSVSFCYFCDVSKNKAPNLEVLVDTGVGGMPISRIIEQCKERWERLESEQISYSGPKRKGQCYPPLILQSGCLFTILHQELRSLAFVLKILSHLMCGIKIWNEASPYVKAKSSYAKAEAIKHIKLACGGFLIDTPMTQGGRNNIGPVVRRFFHPINREASVTFVVTLGVGPGKLQLSLILKTFLCAC